MRLRRFVFASAITFTAGLAACGGAQDKPPGPLARHFDESFIAQIGMDEKQALIKAQSDFNVAKLEQDKATADEREAKTLLDVARNEMGAARLDEQSATTRKKAADASADQNRIAAAAKEQSGAELARRAAEQRVHYLESYQRWLHVLLRYTQHNFFWREAQMELAEAKLAQAKNIQPAGFRYDDYANQEQDRARKTSDAKAKADAERGKAQDERSKWLSIQGEADKTLGKKSEFPDPLAPKPEPTGPSTNGGAGYTVGNDGSSSDQHVPTPDDPTKTAPAPAPQ